MKVSSAFCALSVSSWTLAAPIILSFRHTPPSYSGPQITSADTWPIRSSKFSVGHEIASQDALDGRPDNSPYTPSSDVAPSEALAAPRPLKTSYLLAIKPFMLPAEGKSPKDNAPVSHPVFLESSTVKEEMGSISRHLPTTLELETEGNKPFYKKIPCAIHKDQFHMVRRYADMTVVVIVFVLVALIAVIELWEPICRTLGRTCYGEGRIRLEDDLNKKELSKRQCSEFILQAAPKSRSRTNPIPEKSTDDL